MTSPLTCACIGALLLSPMAFADVRVTFLEGAPKDRFTFANISGCDLTDGELFLDLSTSPAGLVFDTSSEGAGVDVFQPLEITEGGQYLRSVPQVSDGDSQIILNFASFPKDTQISFTIDVDDTIGQREITVNGAEIVGAGFTLKTTHGENSAQFNQNAVAETKAVSCRSR